MNKSFEIKCIDKNCFIKDLSIYNGVSYDISKNWNNTKTDFCLKLYYFKRYSTYDDFVCCDRDYDIFYLPDKDSLLSTYESIKSILKGDI